MGQHGFAELSGDGRRGESVSKFSQRNTVATEHVPELPANWAGAFGMLKDFVKGRLRRFLEDDAA